MTILYYGISAIDNKIIIGKKLYGFNSLKRGCNHGIGLNKNPYKIIGIKNNTLHKFVLHNCKFIPFNLYVKQYIDI